MYLTPFEGTIIGNLVVSAGIILAIFVAKILKKSLNNYLEYITATTVGLLLGIIFLGFLPKLNHAFEENGTTMGLFILLGILLFYILELFLHWHHCKDLGHKTSCGHSHSDSHGHDSGVLMFGGTLMHNAFHGIVLFSAFAVDFKFGIATSIAILLHSIPQNIVNFVMNHNKIKYAYIAALGGIIGALFTYPFADFLVNYKFHFLAIISGGLLYTALADIFPEFKGKGSTKKKIGYLFFIIMGISLFFLFEGISSHEHSESEAVNHNIEILETNMFIDEGNNEFKHHDEDGHDH